MSLHTVVSAVPHTHTCDYATLYGFVISDESVRVAQLEEQPTRYRKDMGSDPILYTSFHASLGHAIACVVVCVEVGVKVVILIDHNQGILFR